MANLRLHPGVSPVMADLRLHPGVSRLIPGQHPHHVRPHPLLLVPVVVQHPHAAVAVEASDATGVVLAPAAIVALHARAHRQIRTPRVRGLAGMTDGSYMWLYPGVCWLLYRAADYWLHPGVSPVTTPGVCWQLHWTYMWLYPGVCRLLNRT